MSDYNSEPEDFEPEDSETEETVRLEVSRSQRETFQRQLAKGRAALTPANLLAAVEGLPEGTWREIIANWGLFQNLGVPDDKLDEIESQHHSLSDRLREVFSYFLRLDPDASWRKVVWALDNMEETKLAAPLRPLAEPVTDPTLTVEAVAAALQSVRDWSKVADWLVLPDSIKHSIRDSHSSDEERKRALADYIVQSLPRASWSFLAEALLWCEEVAALEAVSSHLQREDDPTLTLPNLLSVLEGVTGSFSLGTWLGVPRSKLEGIRSSPSDSERVDRVVKEWLAGHPAPSWRGLARALYRMRGVPEHTALQRVYDKHLPGTEAALPSKELEHGMFHHDNRKLEFDDITLVERIGAGGFGTVFRGRVEGLRGEVAIKQISTNESDKKEIMTLCDLEHPNVITLYGTALNYPHLYIVTELAGLGSLHSHIQKSRGQPDMELSLHWAAGVARGMSYLHERDVVHRDLKSANVLLTSKKTAKLCDFGVARQMDHTTQATQAGTIAWMAPEVIKEAAYSKRCDLFSYGTVLWELVTHEVPFEEKNGVIFYIQMAIVGGEMPPIPDRVADYLTTLIQRCWDKEPKNRPPFTEIISVLQAKGLQEGGPEEGTG